MQAILPDTLDEVFRALADSTRRQLLDRLHVKNGQRASELYEISSIRRSSISKHLAVLQRAKLVIAVTRGSDKKYYLTPMPLYETYDRWIAKYERSRFAKDEPVPDPESSL